MIIRIVKMVFKPEEVEAFQLLFNERKQLIRQFDGCTHLELWQDKEHPHTFFTYSHWISENYLNAYRTSTFFEDTWFQTKQKFAAPPQAWSVKQLHQL
jgi:quinol monooxygenase YgiN